MAFASDLPPRSKQDPYADTQWILCTSPQITLQTCLNFFKYEIVAEEGTRKGRAFGEISNSLTTFYHNIQPLC